jgi:hypothetical protein
MSVADSSHLLMRSDRLFHELIALQPKLIQSVLGMLNTVIAEKLFHPALLVFVRRIAACRSPASRRALVRPLATMSKNISSCLVCFGGISE